MDDLKITSLPGADSFADDLTKLITQRFHHLGPDYRPRTHHLLADGRPKYTNRLILETSPYLLQHAHNPVNWFAWGPEAFSLAEKLNLPILVSIGYSTCHWCHVMEEESFEDEGIARYLNENFIAIKLDREERPDIDAVYMAAVQAMTGSGGWPLNVWLTPDKKPFFGGTYFPPLDGFRGANMGFLSLLKMLKRAFQEQAEQISTSSEKLVEALNKGMRPEAGDALPGPEAIRQTVAYYKDNHDPVNGGMSGAPKFPSSLSTRLLYRYYSQSDDSTALVIANKTLTKMAQGGIYDQVGGGFHRYSTDPFWLVPHFEKMLYDNALLTLSYLDGYQATRDPEFKRVAQDILEYVTRDMTSVEGGFFSATDADSLDSQGRREEGWYFTWTLNELEEAGLTTDELQFAKTHYLVSERGNFEGRSILNTQRSVEETALSLGHDLNRAEELLCSARKKLYRFRQTKPLPIRDEKVLVSWNGLMISAFAKAGLILSKPEYLKTAEKAAGFLISHMITDDQLMRSFKDGQARHLGVLDDYAFFIAGLLDLFESTGTIDWLKQAQALDTILALRFEDSAGGFFMMDQNQENLLAREMPAYDGAEPSGNSIAALNLLRLYQITGNSTYLERALRLFKSFSGNLKSRPMILSEMLIALDFYLAKGPLVILLKSGQDPKGYKELLDVWRSSYSPQATLIQVQENQIEELSKIIPALKGKSCLNSKSTAYFCIEGSCRLPTSDAVALGNQLKTE